MARVREVIFISILPGFRFRVFGSMSTKNGLGALVQHRIACGDESEGRQNDLIAFADAQCAKAEMQPRGSRTHGDAIRNACGFGYRFLEFHHSRPDN